MDTYQSFPSPDQNLIRYQFDALLHPAVFVWELREHLARRMVGSASTDDPRVTRIAKSPAIVYVSSACFLPMSSGQDPICQ